MSTKFGDRVWRIENRKKILWKEVTTEAIINSAELLLQDVKFLETRLKQGHNLTKELKDGIKSRKILANDMVEYIRQKRAI